MLKISKIISGVYKLVTLKRSPLQYYNSLIYMNFMKNPSEVVPYDPPHITFFASYECTLSCKMCLTHSPFVPDNPYKYQGSKMLSFEMFKEAIDKFRRATTCAFIGNGEPLLNRHIFKMIEYASKKRKMYTSLCTNGTLLLEYIDDIISSPLEHISISINGHTPQIYNHITGMGKKIFEKIKEGIIKLVEKRNLKKKNLRIGITFILDKHTLKYAQEMINFGEEIGVDEIGLNAIMPYPFTVESARRITLFVDDPEVKSLFNLRKPSRKIKVFLPKLLEEKEFRLCRDAFSSMSIDGDGNVGGCERMMLNTADNGKFWDKDVFNNHHFRYLRRVFLNPAEKLPDPCKVCYNNSPHQVYLND